MKSARRIRYIAKKQKAGKSTFLLLKFLIPAVLIIATLTFIKLSTHIWNGQDKVAVAYRLPSGDAAVTVLDPALSEVTTLVIPGETEVDISRNLGTMRIKNVWQLGINEKVGGALLPETITENFLFPVFLWGDSDSTGLGTGNFSQIFNFILGSKNTNIYFGDRVAMGLFAMKIQDFGRTTIDLGKSDFLDKKILEDGTAGYEISGPISQRLTVYFSDNENSDQNIRVNIVDATGSPGVSEKVGEILQVIGGKVVSIDKKTTPEDSDCVIYGTNSDLVKEVSNLFSCQNESGASAFDLDIHLGAKFAKRF
jgi:hypothetical protein